MKKLFTLTFSIFIALTLVACGGTTPPATGDTPPQSTPVQETTQTPSPTPEPTPEPTPSPTPEPPPVASDPQITFTNNSGGKFHLLTIRMSFGQYNTSESYDVIEDGDTVLFDLFVEQWDYNHMVGALETEGFSTHEYMLPDGIPVGSTIILLANNEFSIVAPDGSVSN